jgi:hypothetical protein
MSTVFQFTMAPIARLRLEARYLRFLERAIDDPTLTVHVDRARQEVPGLALVEAGLTAAPQTVAMCLETIVHTGVLRERKDPYDASSSSKVLACFKSSVSKPSVNQP